jgi:hypothetical protein
MTRPINTKLLTEDQRTELIRTIHARVVDGMKSKEHWQGAFALLEPVGMFSERLMAAAQQSDDPDDGPLAALESITVISAVAVHMLTTYRNLHPEDFPHDR